MPLKQPWAVSHSKPRVFATILSCQLDLHISTAYADSYVETTRESTIEISMARREIDPKAMIDDDGVTSDLLKISSALNSFHHRWLEAYPPRQYRNERANRSKNLRKDRDFDSGRYVAELKRILHPSKLGGVVKAETWLQNVERELRNLRSQHTSVGTPAAARRQGHRHLY